MFSEEGDDEEGADLRGEAEVDPVAEEAFRRAQERRQREGNVVERIEQQARRQEDRERSVG